MSKMDTSEYIQNNVRIPRMTGASDMDPRMDRNGADMNYRPYMPAETSVAHLLGYQRDEDMFYTNQACSDIEEDLGDYRGTLPQTQISTQPYPSTSAYQIPEQGRTLSEEELMFRLRFAHLSPEINWFDEVRAISHSTCDMGVYQRVLTTLRDYPLSIGEKILLAGQIRAKLEASSLASSNNALSANTRSGKSKKKGEKTRQARRWMSGLSAPFGLWENNIGRIAAYFGSHVASYFQFLRYLALLNAGIGFLMFLFVSVPQIVDLDVWSDDVHSGTFGGLSHTIFFYGAYANTSLGSEWMSISYHRPLAYLMTWCTGNLLVILLVVFSMFVSYRRVKKAADEGDEPFSNDTFLGWDHSVTSREGSKMRSLAITTHMKEMLREEKVKRRLTTKEKIKLWCIRLACNLVSVAILAASSYLIYFMAGQSIDPHLELAEVVDDFLKKNLLAIVVTCLKLLIPPLLSLLMLLERYHPRTQVKVQIARTAVFYVASLVVFLASIYSVAIKCMAVASPNETTYCCWENEVGEQLFQVVVLNLAITVLVGLCFTGGRAVLVKLCSLKKFGYQSFNVADLILDLVYGQSLVWLGLYFAPFLALVGVLNLIIVFYLNYALARTSCVPPNKMFRASRSGTFYLFVLLVTLFVCLFPMTYAIIQLEPSTSCGPFKHNSRVYEVLTNEIGETPDWFQNIIAYAITPAVVIPVLIVLLLIILYYRAKSTVHKMEAKELRYLLQFERKVEKKRVFARAKLEHGVSVISGMDM